MVTLELTYRACELTNNLDPPLAETIEVYKRFLQSIEKVAAAQMEAGYRLIAAAPGDARITLPAQKSDIYIPGQGCRGTIYFP